MPLAPALDESLAVSAPAPAGALAGPRLDPLLLGGLSFLVPLTAVALFSSGAAPQALGRLEKWLVLALVSPHFLVSYQLLYWDRRKDLLRERKLLFAAVLVPAALAALLADVWLSSSPVVPLRLLVHGMLALSCWHYLKQSYGCAVVGCALAGSPLAAAERRALYANLVALGAWAFCAPNAAGGRFDYGGLSFARLAIPPAACWAAAAAFVLSLGRLGQLLAGRWREGRAPAPAATAALLGFYIWTAPILVYPAVFSAFRFVPLTAALHSLQYLTFAGPLRWNRLSRLAPGPVSPRRVAGFAGGWLLMATVLGPALFYRLPGWLDRAVAYDAARLGPIFFLGAIHLFVNVHHYFIDGAIWRSDNEELRALVASRRGR